MDDSADTAQVIIRPPLAWGFAVIAGLALDWLVPLPFLPADLPAGWLGAMVFVLALAAQPHLPRPVPGSDRLGHCVRQSLAAECPSPSSSATGEHLADRDIPRPLRGREAGASM